MTATTGFDRLLTEALVAVGPQELPAGFVDTAFEMAEAVDQRQPSVPVLDTRAWPARRGTPADPAMRRLVFVAVVALLVVAMVATVLSIGRPLLRPQYRNIFVQTGPIPGQLRSVWPVTMADGRVLVIGGWPGAQDNNATRAASILDPATGAFARTGDMLTEHDNGHPVALADGRILVVAGMRNAVDPASGLTPPMSAVELYDPATGTFRLTGPLSSPRYGMTVIRLRDGRVLVAGGAECLGVPEGCPDRVAAADLYDPATERFTPTGPLAVPMNGGAPALLADGRVLIVGYGPPDEQGLQGPAVSQLYDPTTGRSHVTAPTTRACAQLSVVERRDDGPLVVCSATIRRTVLDEHGQPKLHRGDVMTEEVLAPSTVEAYDPVADRFTQIATLPFPADGAIERLDGRVIVYGRRQGTIVGEQGTWAGVFDPSTRQTTLIAAPSRTWPATAVLPDGRIAFVSGNTFLGGAPMYDAEILE